MANSQGIRYSKTSPAFLHANSTSHTWIFSAIAELIDNSYDPDVGAKTLAIDVLEINNVKCLTFKDDGGGLDLDLLHKMLSFGYCEKTEINGIKPIGHYGNGFKSGSMRLGKDAIVFTKQKETMSVGFLSQTFLKQIGSDSVIVPIVSWNTVTRRMLPLPQMQENLKAIISYSIFKNAHSLLQELLSIETKTGTKIVIYNLNRYHSLEGAPQYELDFMSDRDDILNPEMAKLDAGSVAYEVEYKPKYRKSLREYCSILFLKPRLRIMIRGKKVKTKLISKSLSNTESDSYRPRWLDAGVPIIFGFSPSRDEYGMMMYHRNRLITAFERVGCQKEANVHGVGVVGVIEADFLTPIHNKQDFNKTDRFNALMVALASKLNDYWFEKKCRPESAQNARGNSDNYFILNDAGCIIQDWYWAQCDKCLKWRRLPEGQTDDTLPDKWYCKDSKDPERNTCEAPEENIDSAETDVGRASYDKTVKKKKEEEKRVKKAKEEAEKRHSLTKMAQMQRENAKLKKKMIEMEKSAPLEEEDEGKGDEEIRECKPTVADLEAAQKELNEAKKREMKQHLVIRKMQKERKSQEDKESTLKKLCTKTGKKLKKIKEIAPDVLRTVMTGDGDSEDEDCITLDSDDEGVDFTDPGWMEQFLTDDDRQRDVKPNIADLDKSIDTGKPTESANEESLDDPDHQNGVEEDPEPVAANLANNLAVNNDLFSASDDEDDGRPRRSKQQDKQPSPTSEENGAAETETTDDTATLEASKEPSEETNAENGAQGGADSSAEPEESVAAPELDDSTDEPAPNEDNDAEDAPEPMDHNDDDDDDHDLGGAAEDDDDDDDGDNETQADNDAEMATGIVNGGEEEAEEVGDNEDSVEDGSERRKSGRIQKGGEEKDTKEEEEKRRKEQLEKENAKEAKLKQKEQERLEKEKEKERREKEKELERERKEKEKEKERKEKERERERKEKEKEKERIAKEKEKERLEREKEKERERIEKEKEKEKERERREKERERERQEKLREKEKREKEKEKERLKKEKVKEKERLRKEKEKEKERKLKEKEAEKEKRRIEREERKKKAEEEGKELEAEEEEEEEEAEEEGPESEGEADASDEENETTDDVAPGCDKEKDSSLEESRKRKKGDGEENEEEGGVGKEKVADDDNNDDGCPEKKKAKGIEDEDKSEDLLRFVDEKTKENSTLRTQISTLEKKLKDLRADVSELIKIIVPDVDVEAMLIDDLVRQVITENKQT